MRSRRRCQRLYSATTSLGMAGLRARPGTYLPEEHSEAEAAHRVRTGAATSPMGGEAGIVGDFGMTMVRELEMRNLLHSRFRIDHHRPKFVEGGKLRPLRPQRICRKTTGPGDVSLIRSAMRWPAIPDSIQRSRPAGSFSTMSSAQLEEQQNFICQAPQRR